MLEILDANFSQHHRRAVSGDDLAEKNWVILIRDDACRTFRRILHFPLFYQTLFEGAPIAVIYSGDTIIEKERVGSAALPRT